MTKFFKILGIVFCGLIVLSLVFSTIDERQNGPRQSFEFLNTSCCTKSVTFEGFNDNDQLSNTWSINDSIKASDILINRIKPNKYKVTVWTDQGALHNEMVFKFDLENPNESSYELYRFDLAMDKHFAIVNLNAIYSGGSFAEIMSETVGTNQSSINIVEIYDGSVPFLVSEEYTNRTFVDLKDKLPSEVRYGEVVYGLFYYPSSLSENQAHDYVLKQVYDKLNNK